MDSKDLQTAIFGLRIALLGIAISLASTVIGLFFSQNSQLLQNIIGFILIIVTLIIVYLAVFNLPNVNAKTSYGQKFAENFKKGWQAVITGYIGGLVFYITTLQGPLSSKFWWAFGTGIVLTFLYAIFSSLDN